MKKTAIVTGAGILGLATARALSLRGYQVTVIERDYRANGASTRNFGMLWPIGQPDGQFYDRAVRSRNVWKEIAEPANIWHQESGSLHLAYHADEWEVLNQLYTGFRACWRPVRLLTPQEILHEFNGINPAGLLGGLFSSTEMLVDPREALLSLPAYFAEAYGIHFIWGKQVTAVQEQQVFIGKESLHADIICICSGADFETLYPEHFAQVAITKCKLQMMRFSPAITAPRLGTAICGGLSLIHYQSFKIAASLEKLRQRYQAEMADYLQYGIHVMVAQNEHGELTVGDSHEYGLSFDPFDRSFINDLITSYLSKFMLCNSWRLKESWHGIYPRMTNGTQDYFFSPQPGVFLLNGMGGAGMTMSFGFAEECCEKM